MTFPKRNFIWMAYYNYMRKSNKNPNLLDDQTLRKTVNELIINELNENKTKYVAAESTFKKVPNHGLILPQLTLLTNSQNAINLTTKNLIFLSNFSFWTFNARNIGLNSPIQMFFPSMIGNDNIDYVENSDLLNRIGLTDSGKIQLIAKQLDLYCQLRAVSTLMNKGQFLYVSQIGDEYKLNNFIREKSDFYWAQTALKHYIEDPMVRLYILNSGLLEMSQRVLISNSYDKIHELQLGKEVEIKYESNDALIDLKKGEIIL